MCHGLFTCVDAGDLHLGELGTMSPALPNVLLGFEVETDDLLSLLLANDLARNGGSGYERRAELRGVSAHEQHFLELDFGTGVTLDFVDRDDVAVLYFELLAAGFE